MKALPVSLGWLGGVESPTAQVHRLANLITAGSHFAGGQGTQKPTRAGGSVLGTSTRTSDVLINLGLNPLRWLREVESPQFGVLSARAPPSPRCTALTAAS